MNIETIKKEWGKNKRIPKHLEEVFYRTIANYEELKDTTIIIVETKFYGTQNTLRAYPPLLSLANARHNRVYPIVINLNKKIPISFYSLSFAKQQGILAHEFAHILDYARRSSLGIVKLSLNFMFSKKFTCHMERSTDAMAVEKGLGHYLLEYRKHVLETASAKYVNYIKKTYLIPEQIAEEIKKYPALYEGLNLTFDFLSSDVGEMLDKAVKKKKRSMKKMATRIGHSLKVFYGFFPAIIEMIILISIKKIHKNPDWYSEAV